MQQLKTSSKLLISTLSVIIGTQAVAASDSVQLDKPMTKAQKTIAAPINALEIVGVGVNVETWRNHFDYPKFNLWDAVAASKSGYIISQDSKKYPRNLQEWQMIASKRGNDAIEMAMIDFMDRYPLPIAVVGANLLGPAAHDAKRIQEKREANAYSFVGTKDTDPYTAIGEFSGLLTQSGQVMNSYLNDNPDKLWNVLFTTFDEHTDIPAIGVAVKDGVIDRSANYYKVDPEKFKKLSEPAYSIKHPRILSDSQTFITLIRRGRIDWLRPYAELAQDTMKIKNRGSQRSRNWSEFDGWKKIPDHPFVPTAFINKPWTRFQVDQYDHLETLGRVHRPQEVSYLDEHEKPVNVFERKTRLEAALRAALVPLGGKMPTRIFYDYNSVEENRNNVNRFLPFANSIKAVDAEFDLFNPQHGYDLASILGDLGAGSPFVAVALATMAGQQSGGATLVANLRREDGATLLLITPPTDAERKRDAAIKRPFWPQFYGFN